MLVSNCKFDRRKSFSCLRKPFNLLVDGNKSGNWLGVRDDFRNYLITAA